MENKLKCLVCGTQFVSKRKGRTQTYCSLKCRSKDYYSKYYIHFAWKKERICKQCGKVFVPSQVDQNKCSPECIHKYAMKRKIERRAEKRIPIPCKWCQKIFKPNTTIQIFCSNECQTKNYMKESMGVKRVGYHSSEQKCIQCGNQIIGKMYCSKKCLDRWERVNKPEQVRLRDIVHSSKRRSLKKQIGGSFTKEQWESMKIDYNFTCPDCGRSEPEIKLTVDHIIPITKWTEWAKKNNPQYLGNDIENIKPLCWQCNSFKKNKIIN
jgi:5-methylcytosine-specific restriction endonuclease McrA